MRAVGDYDGLAMRAVVLLVTSLVGCSSARASVTEKACADTADAIAKAAQRCGEQYSASYDAFVATAAAGSCGNIVRARDELALRGTCFPALGAATCDDLRAGKIDVSCTAQLIR